MIARKHIRALCLAVALMACASVCGQAGKNVEQFLNMPTGARQAAMGGVNISLYDNDLNFALANPALLNAAVHNYLGVNYSNLFNNINIASAIYSRSLTENDIISVGLHYLDYGTLIGTNEYNDLIGAFYAKDMACYLSYARRLSPSWSVGVTLKPIWSIYEQYQSGGLGFDFGISYHNVDVGFSAGLALRNAGFWHMGAHSVDGIARTESLPLDLQIGATQKIPKIPFRISVELHNMQTWDLSYSAPEGVTDQMNKKSAAARGADMFFRHTVFAVELIPSKYFYLVVSYNHRRRREMLVPDKRSIAGFAFGGGFKAYKFNVGFSVVPYQAGSIGYNLTFSTNLSEFGIK